MLWSCKVSRVKALPAIVYVSRMWSKNFEVAKNCQNLGNWLLSLPCTHVVYLDGQRRSGCWPHERSCSPLLFSVGGPAGCFSLSAPWLFLLDCLLHNSEVNYPLTRPSHARTSLPWRTVQSVTSPSKRTFKKIFFSKRDYYNITITFSYSLVSCRSSTIHFYRTPRPRPSCAAASPPALPR